MNDTVIRFILYRCSFDVELIEKELETQKLNILLSPVDGKEAFTERWFGLRRKLSLYCASRTLHFWMR
jgi:hypothetical protein